jgi:mannose-6-phosphate isomerase-like protein (cupin superfamily)
MNTPALPPLPRRRFLQWTGLASVALGLRLRGADVADAAAHGPFYVPAEHDRDNRPFKLNGLVPTCIKVATGDTGGELFVFECRDIRGGPPRHLHHAQDEWFYCLEGEFAFEVGEQKFTLRTGDSLFAPRKVPHVFASRGQARASLLAALTPAGTFEEFIRATGEFTQPPAREVAAKLHAAHGMQLVGPPLPRE